MGLCTQQHPFIYSPKQPLIAYIHCYFANQKGLQKLFRTPKSLINNAFSNQSERQDLNLRPLLPQGRSIKGYEPYIEKLLGIINKVVG
jgi:hypothetical protein